MRIIPSSVQILDSDWTLKGIFRAVENAGRTCYKSIGTRYFRIPEGPENTLAANIVKQAEADPNVVCKKGPSFDPHYYISILGKDVKNYINIESFEEETLEDSANYENLSAEAFVNMLRKNKHCAMLEHGTVYLKMECDLYKSDLSDYLVLKYNANRYSRVRIIDKIAYVTTNLRVLEENNWMDDLTYLCEPTQYHARKYTARFICDRAIANEIVRNRGYFGMSFAQESTRYCNYGSDKFNNQLTFIKPVWDLPKSDIIDTNARFESMLKEAEANYMEMLSWGCKPQEARYVLPCGLKTEIIVTGYTEDWEHFFELRSDGAAHPDIRKLSQDLQNQFKTHKLF